MTILDRLRAEPRRFSRAEAMEDLAALAEVRPTARRVGRTTVLLERGELVISQSQLERRWGWTSRKCVRSFLQELRDAGELLGTNLGSTKQDVGAKLTLINYETYAPGGARVGQRRAIAKSKPVRQLAVRGASVGASVPPHTPPVVQTPVFLERSLPLGGVGDGVANARDVDNHDNCHNREQLELEPQPVAVVGLSALADPAAPLNPEHLHYAEELAATLNHAQGENGRVDRDTYRPVAAHHKGTLGAALAIKNAHVPLFFATQYVRVEGQRYKPSARAPQIASLAYLERGCIAAFRELEAKHRQRVGALGERAPPRTTHHTPPRGPSVRAAPARASPARATPTRTGDVVGTLMTELTELTPFAYEHER